LCPLWEGVFLPTSMGFRPRRGVWDMLIAVEKAIAEGNCWVLATDDIKDAFDHVNLAAVMDDHRKYIRDDPLLRLIEVILKGGDSAHRREGIEQGNAYSPAALNIRLHHAHDLGFAQGPS